MTKLILILITIPFITACAVTVTQEAIDSASFGPEPTRDEYIEFIENHFQETLLDPESMTLNCLDAVKGWARLSVTDQPTFGWLVACDVNARNSFGGYSGIQPYLFIFNDDLTLLIRPQDLIGPIAQKVGLID